MTGFTRTSACRKSAFSTRSGLYLLGAACLVLAGCSPPPRTVKVEGKVLHNGAPVENAKVVFLSPYRDELPAWGVTDAAGRYRLATYFSHLDIAEGAIPGEYQIYIEKFQTINSTPIMRKMASIAAEGGDVQQYIRDQALRDLWPNGIPQDWPLDYVPGIMDVPVRLREDQEALQKFTRLQRGIPMLPLRYADPATSGFQSIIERSDEPQIIDFDLTGEVEPIVYRGKDDI
ncbi:MAG TPA: carboxypeptidase-like regulatory domain-containing protein [Pirellulales bacterium]|nr:carboxypeptidase-like regulatory domain-containing protein [Pirellulales bacterium]